MRTTQITFTLMTVALAGLLITAAPVHGREITPGQTISGTLGAMEFSKAYTFDGQEGDFVTILLLAAEESDYVRPSVELTGPSGLSVSDTDSRAAMIECQELPDDGEYTITVRKTGFFFEDFDFVLSLISTGSTNDGGVITYGRTVRGDISPAGDLDGYQFAGRHGDRVQIHVTALAGSRDFSPNVELIGPDGLVESDSGDHSAEIDVRLEDTGNYTIVIWGGEDDWGGGPYELQLIGPGTVPTPTPTPLPLPDLRIERGDFGPAAPTRLQPGGPITLGAFVENLGQASGGFWLEFWGSRTGGLTLDALIASSQYIPGLATLGSYPFEGSRSLSSLPDGLYSVVMVVDRPNRVAEWNEGNNRFVVPNKRILTVRPPAAVNLAVQNFGVSPLPQGGQVAHFTGSVRNSGTGNSGPFWIEFWQSPASSYYPQLGRMICDPISVSNLGPGASIDLSAYPKIVYAGVTSSGQFGVVVDRTDKVNETDKTDNYRFVNGGTTPPRLQVVSANFSPAAPTELRPGSQVTFTADIRNPQSQASGSFWVEFWGSRTGGLSLDAFLAQSVLVNSVGPNQTYHLSLTRPLYAVPDGSYAVVVTADRPRGGAYGRRAVSGKKLRTIRPQTQANLKIEGFGFGSSRSLTHGQSVALTGTVRNTGTQASGPFWIEFWGSRNQMYPSLDWRVCESILVSGLNAGASINLSTHPRTIYNSVPVGSCAIGCFMDRADAVSETNEADNYSFLTGYTVY
jgi:hypothetical protein